MDPDSTVNIPLLATSIGLLLLAFVYSLISRVLACFYARKPADVDEVYAEVETMINSRDYGEIVFQGNFFTSVMAAVVLGLEFAGEHWHLWLAVLACIYFFVIFIPEILAAMLSGTLSKFCIKAYKVLRYIFLPSVKISIFFQDGILKILGYDSRLSFLPESMREAMSSEETSDLEEEEKQMIRNIFVFADTPVRKIMTPRVEMHAIDVQTPLPDVIKLLNDERYSRLPVYSDSIDNIIGVLSNRRFLEWYTENQHDNFDLKKLARPAIFVPTGKKIDALLQELRKCNSHIAIVVDEYGGTAGLVTMEDILEEIVGEIGDEDDSKEDTDMGIAKLPSGQYLLDPFITLSNLEDKLNIKFEIEEGEYIETLSGLIQHSLGSMPEIGTIVKIQGYVFRVKKMDGTKMEEVLMESA
ncbi:MAG: hemolysin family protein [Fibromonadaceae bacterium]|jgi:CBS domain containing-hemolysin-like protein|nr:hemolysin family protein [Fibromonadaceae bacterium]